MHVGLAWECKPGRGLLAHPRPVFRRPDRLQEWVVALSLAPAWLFNVDEWRPGLVQLWRQHMPAAAAVDWWMQQTGAPGGSEGRCSLSRQQQRLSAICSDDYLSLIGELLGPVAGKMAVQHAQQAGVGVAVPIAWVDTCSRKMQLSYVRTLLALFVRRLPPATKTNISSARLPQLPSSPQLSLRGSTELQAAAQRVLQPGCCVLQPHTAWRTQSNPARPPSLARLPCCSQVELMVWQLCFLMLPAENPPQPPVTAL